MIMGYMFCPNVGRIKKIVGNPRTKWSCEGKGIDSMVKRMGHQWEHHETIIGRCGKQNMESPPSYSYLYGEFSILENHRAKWYIGISLENLEILISPVVTTHTY